MELQLEGATHTKGVLRKEAYLPGDITRQSVMDETKNSMVGNHWMAVRDRRKMKDISYT